MPVINSTKKADSQKSDLSALFFFFIVPVSVFAIGTIAGIIPYVGFIFKWIMPLLAFFIYYFIGVIISEYADKFSSFKRRIFFWYAMFIASCSFVTPYVIGYFTYPILVARQYKTDKNVSLSYSQASDDVTKVLHQKIGYGGIVAYAIYAERNQLTAHSYSEYIGEQFEDVDDAGGIITAVLNVLLHSIPMLLKWLLCDKLLWVTEAGMVGLVFWYLISILLAYMGWKSVE